MSFQQVCRKCGKVYDLRDYVDNTDGLIADMRKHSEEHKEG